MCGKPYPLKMREETFPGKHKLRGGNSSPVKLIVVMYGCESWTVKKAEC